MEPTILYFIIAAASLGAGAVAGKFLFSGNTKKQIEEAEILAKKIVSEGQLQAENAKKEKLLEAKEKFVQMKAEHDRDILQQIGRAHV